MTILVTGGAGYIGGHMALALKESGEDYIVLDDLSNGFARAVPEGGRLIVGTTGDYESVLRIIKENNVDTIIHFAATLIMPALYERPLEYYRINASNSRALVQAAADGNVKNFIYSGSSAIYGNPERLPVDESCPVKPVTPYGKSKLIMEYMLEDVSAVTDMNYVVFGYFNVAGADPKGRHGQISTKTTLLVQIAVQAALGLQKQEFEIFGTDYPTKDGTCVRDYLHVTDLIDAHLLALQYLRDGGENTKLNVGYGHGYSVRYILETAEKVTGRNFKIKEGPRRLGDPVEVVAEASLIKSTLGWVPQLDNIETIVQHAYQWELLEQKRREALQS